MFSYIEGYSNNANVDHEFCQIIENDILCTSTIIDLVSYEEIKSVELQLGNSLELQIVGESNLLISNISEESFEMHNRTYNKTTAKNIEDFLPEYQTLDNIFDK